MSGTALADFAAANAVGLTRFAYVLCGDHGLAEDLVQDAFLALHRRFGDVLTLDTPVAYARRIVVNTHISHRRKRMTAATVLGAVPDLPVDFADNAEQAAMWQALGSLPVRQRAVLVMRYYLDLPDTDIAAALDCRPGTVRSLAARAFAALREDPAFTDDQGSR